MIKDNQISKAEKFRTLHTQPKTFIMPNAWDAGSAKMLASYGFNAIATTSAGIAYSLGLPDYEGAVNRAEMLGRIKQIASAVEVPVSADLEAGYGSSPTDVAETITLAIQAGVVGGNIEDYTGNTLKPLFDLPQAIERIKAARAAADVTGIPFTLTARTDCYLTNTANAFSETVLRANAYREAGADCLFIPGASDPQIISELVREIQGPLNVVMGLQGGLHTVKQLEALGVRRISIGGSLARATFSLIRKAAQEMSENGTFHYSNDQIPDAELCKFFSKNRP